jgi:hypothetical protein
MVPIALIAALVAAFDRARTDARRSQCHATMLFIGYRMAVYREVNGRFPPAVTRAADGTAMHSWRALAFTHSVSPVAYNLAQPWDSPGNLQAAAAEGRSTFTCPNTQGDPPRFTNYVAVVDRRGVSTLDLANATGPGLPPLRERILFIEDPDSTVAWSEPRDFAFEALDTLGEGRDPHGLGAVFADGSFRRLPRARLVERLRRQWSHSTDSPAPTR